MSRIWSVTTGNMDFMIHQSFGFHDLSVCFKQFCISVWVFDFFMCSENKWPGSNGWEVDLIERHLGQERKMNLIRRREEIHDGSQIYTDIQENYIHISMKHGPIILVPKSMSNTYRHQHASDIRVGHTTGCVRIGHVRNTSQTHMSSYTWP